MTETTEARQEALIANARSVAATPIDRRQPYAMLCWDELDALLTALDAATARADAAERELVILCEHYAPTDWQKFGSRMLSENRVPIDWDATFTREAEAKAIVDRVLSAATQPAPAGGAVERTGGRG